MRPGLIVLFGRPASRLANLLCPEYLRCALRTRSYMRGVMASHNNPFISPSRRVPSREAYVIESSSPDLPPLQDFFSQTSKHASKNSSEVPKNTSGITTSNHQHTTEKHETFEETSTSKYWNKSSPSLDPPAVTHDTPSTHNHKDFQLQPQDDPSKVSPHDVFRQPWKVFKPSPPRVTMRRSETTKAQRFASDIAESEECISTVDGYSNSATEGQSLGTPKRRSEIKGPKEDVFLPLNLEQAVTRRLDWTPPVPKNVDCDDLTSVFETGVSSSREDYEGRELKSILAGCGYEVPENRDEPLPPGENPGFLTKRKRIELVPTANSNPTHPRPQEESPTKSKAPKKKPRTITELATAAYKLPANDIAETSSATVLEEVKSVETTGSTANNLKAKSKPRKRAAKPSKKKEPKKSVLLSPNTALKAAENQNFVFGTSSQLAREQSPTLLREIQAAMKTSAQFDDSHILDIPINSDCIEPQQQKPKLWEASARDLDGALFDVEIIDLVENSSSPPPQDEITKDPFGYTGAENEPSLPPLSGITMGRGDQSMETLSDILPATNPKISVPIDEPSPFSSSQEVINTDSQKTKPIAETQRGEVSNKSNPLEAETESDLSGQLKATLPCPSYELFTDAQLAKEFASYGFKPVKKRTAMISLLEKCWQSKVGGSGNSVRTFATTTTAFQPRASPVQITEKPSSPKTPRGRPKKNSTPTIDHEQEPPPSGQPASSPPRPRKVPGKPNSAATSLNPKQPVDPPQISPKRGRGRPRKSPPPSPGITSAPSKINISKRKIVVEIPDSASDDEDNLSIPPSSSPESISSPPLAMDLSASMNEDTELYLSLSNSDEQASLFEFISKAVVTAPRSTNLSNPSWHEKILLYDPIILEDLTTWLNLGQLTRVGHDGEVSPGEVKKWCESKSICCLWKANMRGKERKRY